MRVCGWMLRSDGYLEQTLLVRTVREESGGTNWVVGLFCVMYLRVSGFHVISTGVGDSKQR